MRQALANKRPRRQQVSNVQSYPAPIGGWNARESLAAMKPIDAVALDNWFPRTSYVEMRGGYVDHLTAMASTGKTLATYSPITGVNKMFCFTANGVYDASGAGAAGATVASCTNGKGQWVNYGDGTTNYLIFVNGVERPKYFDGTTWTFVSSGTSPALIGMNQDLLIGVTVFKGRLIFIERDSLRWWYLPANAAGGTLVSFDLSGVAQKGGYLMAAASLTIDAGDGPDDRMVFFTSEGEVIAYRGTNPSDANDWAMVGRYTIGKPLGRRCIMKMGGDIILLTQNGAFPLSAVIQSATVEYHQAVSNKIQDAFTQAAVLYGNTYGWSATLFPALGAMLVNVPLEEDGAHHQYVMNTITGAWCKFTDWNAEDFAVYNNELYFCTGTTVVKAWHGQIDGVNAIVAYGKCAFSYFGRKAQQKRFTLFRPVLSVNGSLSFLADVDVDFNDNLFVGTTTFNVATGSLWNVASWNQANWATGLSVIRRWTTPSQFSGYCGAGKIKITTNSIIVQWLSVDYVYEDGGAL